MTLPDVNTTNDDSFVDSRPSLVKKYNIPVENISYEYIKTCKDGREIERIIKILRSGEEGIYPDLLRKAEARLQELRPTSKVLRTEQPALGPDQLEPKRWEHVNTDLQTWASDVQTVDTSLAREAKPSDEVDVPIRGAQSTIICTTDKTASVGAADTVSRDRGAVPRSYAEWDKFDPEEELLRMEAAEERARDQRQASARQRRLVEDVTPARPPLDVGEAALMSATERAALAVAEKNKGNECFKANDLVAALAHFTASLGLQPTLAAFTNRALIYLRLERYAECVGDCGSALSLDADNVKALYRRARAQHCMEPGSRAAYDDLVRAVRLEPGNRAARELMQQVVREGNIVPAGNRMRITEVTSLDPGLQAQAKAALQGGGPPTQPALRALSAVAREPPRINKWGLAANMCRCDGTPSWVNSRPRRQCQASGDSSTDQEAVVEEEKAVEEEEEKAVEEEEEEKAVVKEQKKAVEVFQQAVVEDRRDDGAAVADVGDGMFFLHKWCTLRDDPDLLQHAKLLNSIKPEDLPKVLGAALDEPMLSQLLGCLDSQAELFMPDMRLAYLQNITLADRFGIVKCFVGDKDRLVIRNILQLLHAQGAYVPSALKSCLEQL